MSKCSWKTAMCMVLAVVCCLGCQAMQNEGAAELDAEKPADAMEQLVDDLEKIAEQQPEGDDELYQSALARIEQFPRESSELLRANLQNTSMSLEKKNAYVWALGQTGDPKATDIIINTIKESASPNLHATGMRALASIGNAKAGDYLLAQLEKAPNDNFRFNIVNLLAEMQYEPALPQTMELLQQDPREAVWQLYFVFGKFGDTAVPFLMEHIDHESDNVRGNSIFMLGQWLVAKQANTALQNAFWQENDPGIRGVILSSLEWTATDIESIREFSRLVLARDTNENVLSFARETLDNLQQLQATVENFKRQKDPNPERFQQEYQALYESAGESGNMDVLAETSTVENADELKELRARVLQRNEEAAFEDYAKINNIILLNRFASSDEAN